MIGSCSVARVSAHRYIGCSRMDPRGVGTVESLVRSRVGTLASWFLAAPPGGRGIWRGMRRVQADWQFTEQLDKGKAKTQRKSS